MKVLVGAFNQEKALIGAFSVNMELQSSRSFVASLLSTVQSTLCQDPSPCEHECFNTLGSYKCRCPPGFQLNRDGRTCRDVDECAAGGHVCQVDISSYLYIYNI